MDTIARMSLSLSLSSPSSRKAMKQCPNVYRGTWPFGVNVNYIFRWQKGKGDEAMSGSILLGVDCTWSLPH